MTPEQEICTILKDMGFTELEADIYIYLLQNSPATGYKVASSIGRSFAITYRALKTLQFKGAVMVDAGRKRSVHAIPIQAFLNQRESRFQEQCSRMIQAVEKLPAVGLDDRIYRIESMDQVYQQSRAMLAGARERVLAELFPEPLHQLKDVMEETGKRGVDVTVRIYANADIESVRVVRSPFGDRTISSFRSQWMSVFIDGRQFLLAQLMNEHAGIHYAVYSENLILARAMYAYINSDLHHYAFRERLFQSKSIEEAISAYNELECVFPPGGDAGFGDLIQRFGAGRKSHEP